MFRPGRRRLPTCFPALAGLFVGHGDGETVVREAVVRETVVRASVGRAGGRVPAQGVGDHTRGG